MKRPLVYAAVMTICGTACGIGDCSGAVRLSAAIAALLIILSFKKNSLLLIFSVLLFSTAFLRGSIVYQRYTGKECSEFFEKYEASNPGQFDYSIYLKSLGICNYSDYEAYMQKKNNETEDKAGAIYKVRSICSEILDEELNKEDAGLYKAILLGDRSDMDTNISELYKAAGISHLLAVSGLHIGIIGGGFFKLLKKLKIKKRKATLISSAAVCFYMLLCGASGSTLRAAIMLIIAFAAADHGRSYCMRSALAIASIITVLKNPYMIFTAGFQLSFGAVIGIIYTGNLMTKALEKQLSRLRDKKELKTVPASDLRHFGKRIKNDCRLPALIKTIIISAAIQLTLLPVTAWHYFVFPVYGIVLNLIVIPLMTAVVYSGLATLVSGLAIKFILTVTGYGHMIFIRKLSYIPVSICIAPGHFILRTYDLMCNAVLKLPYAQVCIGRPKPFNIFLYYIILAVLINYAANGKNPIGAMISAYIKEKTVWPDRCLNISLFLKILIFNIIFILNADMLKYRDNECFYVTVLDAGQGDGMAIKYKEHYILVDGGSNSNKKFGERVLYPYLMSKGITNIDAAVISHSDSDHTNGVKYIISERKDINIAKLVFPKAAAYENESYKELEDLFNNKNDINENDSNKNEKDVIYLEDGMMLMKQDEMSLSCIYAGNASGHTDANNESDVLLLKNGNFSMLFTGDMPTEEDEAFIGRYREYKENGSGFDDEEKTYSKADAGITVLKAAHHGSKTSSSDRFLDEVSPESAVLSYGKNNRYGHPSEEVVSRLEDRDIAIVSTNECGALHINKKGIFAAK